MTKNVEKSKFSYNSQRIALDGNGFWRFDNESARNVVILGVGTSSSSHMDNPENNFLVLGEVPTENFNGSVGTSKKKLY